MFLKIILWAGRMRMVCADCSYVLALLSKDKVWALTYFSQGLISPKRRFFQILRYTVFPSCLHSVIEGRINFLNFYHFYKKIQKQIIPHLKALKQCIQNQEKNWVWHHSESSHALLTEKEPLPVKLVWSISQQKFFQF